MVKGEDCYDLTCIDHKTKYLTAHLFVDKRTLARCKEFLEQLKKTCYDQMLERYKQEKNKPAKKRNLFTFVCDGFENYKTAWSILFRRVTKLTHGVPIKAKAAGLKHNNNPIERENGNIKDRIKVMRGGFGSFEGAEGFMNLRHIIHNFVNSHQTIKKAPAEAAEIRIPLGRNRLLDLIRYSARRHLTKRR
jgi:hypothetical protein